MNIEDWPYGIEKKSTYDFAQIPNEHHDKIWIRQTMSSIIDPIKKVNEKWCVISHHSITGRMILEEVNVNQVSFFYEYYWSDKSLF